MFIFTFFPPEWWPIVQVGAVNCADSANVPVCRHYNITGVPTIKVSLLYPAREPQLHNVHNVICMNLSL